MPRWETSIWIVWLGTECRDKGLALLSVWLGDGVLNWEDYIGECMTRGLNVERVYIAVCMARVNV